MALGTWCASLVDFVWPPACPACGAVGSDLLCAACSAGVVRLSSEQRPFAVGDPVEGGVAVLSWASPARELLLRVKYGRDPHPLVALTDLLVRGLAHGVPQGGWDGVAPLPTYRRRVRQRGLDHVQELAGAVGQHLALPVWAGALRRVESWWRPVASPQAGRSGRSRRRDLRNTFAVRRNVGGSRVLLVDDVVTTGSTLRAAAEVLVAGGAVSVGAVCLFRTLSAGSG